MLGALGYVELRMSCGARCEPWASSQCLRCGAGRRDGEDDGDGKLTNQNQSRRIPNQVVEKTFVKERGLHLAWGPKAIFFHKTLKPASLNVTKPCSNGRKKHHAENLRHPGLSALGSREALQCVFQGTSS